MRAVIKRAVITEKTTKLAEDNNQYTFEVTLDADKDLAATQIEKIYNVEVESVQSHTRLGKVKRSGKYRAHSSRRPSRKFMVFKLKEGQEIGIFKQ